MRPTDEEEYEEILKKYLADKKRYYENFKNKNVFQETCELCQGHYNYYSKNKHLQTKKHLEAEFFKIRNPIN